MEIFESYWSGKGQARKMAIITKMEPKGENWDWHGTVPGCYFRGKDSIRVQRLERVPKLRTGSVALGSMNAE